MNNNRREILSHRITLDVCNNPLFEGENIRGLVNLELDEILKIEPLNTDCHTPQQEDCIVDIVACSLIVRECEKRHNLLSTDQYRIISVISMFDYPEQCKFCQEHVSEDTIDKYICIDCEQLCSGCANTEDKCRCDAGFIETENYRL